MYVILNPKTLTYFFFSHNIYIYRPKQTKLAGNDNILCTVRLQIILHDAFLCLLLCYICTYILSYDENYCSKITGNFYISPLLFICHF
jgi:hypothetical protein